MRHVLAAETCPRDVGRATAMGATRGRERAWLGRFGRDRRGGFGIMLALAALPMTIAVGAGFDTSHALTARSDLQNATDEAALSLAHQPYDASTSGQAAAKTSATSWVQANFNRSDSTIASIAAITSPTQVEVKGSATVKLFFASLLKIPSIQVNADSVVNRSLKKVELALVLDNTGSMNESDGSGSTKAATLKNAATTLIDTLSASASASGTANVFQVAMVPFATYVNAKNIVGNKNPDLDPSVRLWMTGSSQYPNDAVNNANRFQLLTQLGTTWGGCMESRPAPYDVQDTTPIASSPQTMFVPYFAPDEPDDTIVYSGVTFDQYYNNYVNDGTTSTSRRTRLVNSSKYTGALKPAGVSGNRSIYEYLGYTGANTRGPNKDCPDVRMMALSTDFSGTKSAINALAPQGNTHIPLGLAWGWHLLSPNMPFGSNTAYPTTPGSPCQVATEVCKIIVLVTDGDNTYNQGGDCGFTNGSRCNDQMNSSFQPVTDPNGSYINDGMYTSFGYPWQQRITTSPTQRMDDALDTRLSLLCKNIKSSGVVLYVVPLLVGAGTTKTTLQGCASGDSVGPSGTKYLDAQTGAQLTQDFANIAGQISALRIAR